MVASNGPISTTSAHPSPPAYAPQTTQQSASSDPSPPASSSRRGLPPDRSPAPIWCHGPGRELPRQYIDDVVWLPVPVEVLGRSVPRFIVADSGPDASASTFQLRTMSLKVRSFFTGTGTRTTPRGPRSRTYELAAGLGAAPVIGRPHICRGPLTTT